MSVPWYIKRTQEERRERYKRLKEAGFPVCLARILRDWQPRIIEALIKGERPMPQPHCLVLGVGVFSQIQPPFEDYHHAPTSGIILKARGCSLP